jgi:hypothetical protein
MRIARIAKIIAKVHNAKMEEVKKSTVGYLLDDHWKVRQKAYCRNGGSPSD